MSRLKKSLASSLRLLVAVTVSWPALAKDMPFNGADAVDDGALDQMRGGIEMPNGLDVSIGIDIQTRVNGALVLRTTFSTESPQIAVTHVYTDGVSTSTGQAGQSEVPVQANGATVTTPFGAVSQQSGDRGTIVNLTNQSLTVQHLIGQTSGAIIANTANNQTIDTITTMNIDVKGMIPAITNSLFTVNELAGRAMARP